MFTRKDIIDYSVRMGCNKDLTMKGMATTPYGDVFCIATLCGEYPDHIYFINGIRSPKEAYYCGVYGNAASSRLDIGNYETRKNIAVTKANGIDRFVYFFEKTSLHSKLYYFHGRYKYVDHEITDNTFADEPHAHPEDILFHLEFVDRPDIIWKNK